MSLRTETNQVPEICRGNSDRTGPDRHRTGPDPSTIANGPTQAGRPEHTRTMPAAGAANGSSVHTYRIAYGLSEECRIPTGLPRLPQDGWYLKSWVPVLRALAVSPALRSLAVFGWFSGNSRSLSGLFGTQGSRHTTHLLRTNLYWKGMEREVRA